MALSPRRPPSWCFRSSAKTIGLIGSSPKARTATSNANISSIGIVRRRRSEVLAPRLTAFVTDPTANRRAARRGLIGALAKRRLASEKLGADTAPVLPSRCNDRPRHVQAARSAHASRVPTSSESAETDEDEAPIFLLH